MRLVVQDLGLCPYGDALTLQEQLVARKIAGDTRDYLLLVEHPPVYTLGRGADAGDLQGADRRLGVPAVRIGRGGGVTFHGPGQLVAYPILTLGRGGRDVHRYVRTLEQWLVRTCSIFGIAAATQPGATGVWVGDRKIASIGIGVRRWTTFHGVALNVDTDLSYFEHIVPCRMPALRMTSMALERGAAPAMPVVRATLQHEFGSLFGYHDELPAEMAG